MNDKFLHCPFCGKDPIYSCAENIYKIFCICGCSITANDYESLLKIWNTRIKLTISEPILPNLKKRKNNVMPTNITKEIIGYLNEKTKSNFKYSNCSAIKHINARIEEGYTIDDFKIVIDKKCIEWNNTDFEKFLRPQTLFGTKFDSYLNQGIKKDKDNEYYINIYGKIKPKNAIEIFDSSTGEQYLKYDIDGITYIDKPIKI